MKNFSPYVLCKRFMLRHVKVEVDSLSAGHESLRLEEEYKVGSCDEWCAYSCQFLIETACHTDRRDELSTWFITSCFSKKQKAISINCHARQKKIFPLTRAAPKQTRLDKLAHAYEKSFLHSRQSCKNFEIFFPGKHKSWHRHRGKRVARSTRRTSFEPCSRRVLCRLTHRSRNSTTTWVSLFAQPVGLRLA